MPQRRELASACFQFGAEATSNVWAVRLFLDVDWLYTQKQTLEILYYNAFNFSKNSENLISE